jgi:hypothetical protein
LARLRPAPNNATVRFLWRFTRPRPDVEREREVLFATAVDTRGATVYLPSRAARGHPAWILLHGITVGGRHHDAVRRMARCLSAAGQVAFVPEVPAWRALSLDPGETRNTLDAAVKALPGLAPVDPGRVGVLGFSVAGRWALSEAARPGAPFRAVASFGGYADLARMMIAMVVGEHEWDGRQYRYWPDPYGRWIMGANLLPLLAGQSFGSEEGLASAAKGLGRLALTAGRNGAMAYEPVYDSLIASIRAGLPDDVRDTWDILAAPSHRPVPDRVAGRAHSTALANAGMTRFPELGRTSDLDGLTAPVTLVHGRYDRLVPFTETLRLHAELPAVTPRSITITRLFGHTRTREAISPRNPVAWTAESWRFALAIQALLKSLAD